MDANEYGQALACQATIEKREVMDVAVAGDLLFFVGSGRLYVADIRRPASPALVGECPFPGAGRQLAVAHGVAYVTARADGVFLFDVRDPRRPSLLSHYDCIELATGIEVQGDLLFVAQRQYGVEIVDVGDPRHPVHVSKIKTGEAQSVAARGRYLYVGDWGVSKLTTIDIGNPRRPAVVASHDLDGFGDGVCVAGDFLYASTGHHSRRMGAFQAEGDPGYGMGHGLEVFSLAEPERPRHMGRTKFPRLYHRGGYDMWSPVDAGRTVCCADTFNGVFLVDASAPESPRAVARHHDLVAGVAVVDDIVYAACPKAGLRVLSAPGLVRRAQAAAHASPPMPPRAKETATDHRAYRPGGQVWSVDFCGDRAVVAAGMAGVRLVELWPAIRELGRLETEGFAVHAHVAGPRVLVSESTGGLSVWQLEDAQFRLLGRYRPRRGGATRQCVAYANGTVAVLQVGSVFEILDVSDPARVRKMAEHRGVIVYHDQMARGDIGGRYGCVWCHVDGIRWLDFAAPDGKINTGINLAATYGFFAGIASLGDRFLCTYPGGYRLAEPLDTGLEARPFHSFGGHFLGKPSVCGSVLVLSSRVRSEIAVADIGDLARPRLLRQWRTDGNPGAPTIRNGALVVPDGYNGLLVYDDFVATLGPKVEGVSLPAPGAR